MSTTAQRTYHTPNTQLLRFVEPVPAPAPSPSPIPRNQRVTRRSILGKQLRKNLLISAALVVALAGGIWLYVEGPPRWKVHRGVQYVEQVLTSADTPADPQWGAFVSIEGSGYEVVRRWFDVRNVSGHVIARRVAVFENARIPLAIEVTNMEMFSEFVGQLKRSTWDDLESHVTSEVDLPKSGPVLFCLISKPGYRLPKAR